MKQVIPFVKDLIFKTKIAEITSISLEKNIHIEDDDMLSGDFTVTGKYKMTDASQNEELFNYSIPFDIALDYRYDNNNSSIEITDFEYEIINSDVLRVKIDVTINNLELREEEVKVVNMDVRECDEEKDIPIPLKEEKEIVIPVVNKIDDDDRLITPAENIKSLFDSIDDSDETHKTYKVYIVREEDSLESILIKYNLTKDEFCNYNDTSDISLGDKLIIPYKSNE